MSTPMLEKRAVIRTLLDKRKNAPHRAAPRMSTPSVLVLRKELEIHRKVFRGARRGMCASLERIPTKRTYIFLLNRAVSTVWTSRSLPRLSFTHHHNIYMEPPRALRSIQRVIVWCWEVATCYEPMNSLKTERWGRE